MRENVSSTEDNLNYLVVRGGGDLLTVACNKCLRMNG